MKILRQLRKMCLDVQNYCNLVRRYIRQGYDESNISEILKSEGLPMSLNLYMYIRQQLKEGVDND